MKTKNHNKTPRIRLWIAAFAAILVCFACPFISLADDEPATPYDILMGSDSLVTMYRALGNNVNMIQNVTKEQAINLITRASALYYSISAPTPEQGQMHIDLLKKYYEHPDLVAERAAEIADESYQALTQTSGNIPGGKYRLESDIQLTGILEIGKSAKVTIDLNGHAIIAAKDKCIIQLDEATSKHAQLTLIDTQPTQNIHYFESNANGAWKLLPDTTGKTGYYIIPGGILTGGRNVSSVTARGGAINASPGSKGSYGGITVFNGGTIVGNYSSRGGGAAYGGKFVMQKGAIVGNYANQFAGAIAVSGILDVSNGLIIENKMSTKSTHEYTKDENQQFLDVIITTGNGSEFEFSGGEIFGNVRTVVSASDPKFYKRGGTLYGDYYLMNGTEAVFSGGAVYGRVYMEKGSCTVTGDAIISNQGSTRSSAVHIEGVATFIMDGGMICDSWATEHGGGIYLAANDTTTCTISGGVIENCEAPDGGAIYIKNGNMSISGGEIKSNVAFNNGGAVYMAAGTFAMTGGSITDCHSETGSGGAVYLGGGAFDLNGGNITNCTAVNGNGGGIYLGGGDLAVAAGRLSGNKAINGGGAYVNAATAEDGVLVSGGTIYNNTATRNGGGVAVNNGTYRMTGGTVDDNTAALAGGGIYVSAEGINVTVDIRSGVVSNNDAGTSGGALAVVGPEGGEETITVTIGINEVHPCNHNYEGGENIKDCPEITGNFATESGGGVYITGGKETHLNTYCMTEENNLAETKPLADNKSKSNFMMVEGGTVILSTAEGNTDTGGDDHGKIIINNTIHVYAGHVDLYGSVENPLIKGNMTVDVPDERGSFEDHRTGGASQGEQKYFRIQYCENFYDPELDMITGQYTVILVEKEDGKDYAVHEILPALYEHDGYMIDGWWTSKYGEGTEYKVNTKYELTDDLQLWAKWLLIGYYVHFEPGTDGDYRGSMETVRYEYDKEETLPANQFFITGKQFIGWDKDGDGVSDLDDMEEVSKLTTGREITLTAMWVECNHAARYLTVLQSGANSLVRTCVCEACTQTATLTAEDSVYDGTQKTGATVRITGGSTNTNPAPAWDEVSTIIYTATKFDKAETPISDSEMLIGAGNYTATIESDGQKATVSFLIKKANRPNPEKPEYDTKATNANVPEGKIVIKAPSDTSLKDYLKYKIVWYNDGGIQAMDEKTYSDATSMSIGFNLNTTYTNYYVYAMYEGDDNHNPSEWIKADAVLFYKGKVYIYITTDSGIDYETRALDGDRGLAIIVKALNNNYLYNTKITDDNDNTSIVLDGAASLTTQTFNMTSIPEPTEGTLSINVSITGVRKKVVITSTVEQSEVFGQVKSDTASISRDSAYTAYYDIKNFHYVYAEPQLSFSYPLPKDATVILVDKSSAAPAYYSYRASGEESVIPLYGTGGFIRMGTANTSYFSVPVGSVDSVEYFDLKYQVIVDFSDCQNVIGGGITNLTTSFSMAINPANAPQFTDNGISVTLEEAQQASVNITPGGIQAQVEVTVPVGSAASSKWLGRSYALILTYYDTATAEELPADVYIEAVDTQNNVSPTYRNTEGEYIIPVTGGMVTLTLRSDMFGAGEESYPFTVKLVTVQSGAAKSSANGDELASGSVQFTKAKDIAEPAVSVNTNGKTSYKSGETVCAVVKAENQPADTILVLRLLSRGLPGTEAGEKYTDTGWKVSIGEKTNGDQTTTGGTVSSGVTELETGGYKVEVPLGDTPEGTGSLVLELRDAAGDVITSAECYFTIVGR